MFAIKRSKIMLFLILAHFNIKTHRYLASIHRWTKIRQTRKNWKMMKNDDFVFGQKRYLPKNLPDIKTFLRILCDLAMLIGRFHEKNVIPKFSKILGIFLPNFRHKNVDFTVYKGNFSNFLDFCIIHVNSTFSGSKTSDFRQIFLKI